MVLDNRTAYRQAHANPLRLGSEEWFEYSIHLLGRKSHARSCLVLDVRLPGISGLDFQRQLAKANIRIPIIFITAHGDVSMSVKAMKAGAMEFLIKPFHDQDLLDAVQMALDKDRVRRLSEAEIGSSQIPRLVPLWARHFPINRVFFVVVRFVVAKRSL